MSDATKNSPSPRPTTTGGPLRTATIVSGSSAEIDTSANSPRTRVERTPHRRHESVAPAFLLDQVRDDLRVSLRDEAVPLAFELALELEVVLDDAVVHDDDAAVQSRCGCAFSSVGRPCVAQRVWPMPKSPSMGSRASTSSRFESLPALRRICSCPSRTTRDAGRVVAAVLEAMQSIHQDRQDRFVADVADDAAHALNVSLSLFRGLRPRGPLVRAAPCGAVVPFDSFSRSRRACRTATQSALFSCRPRAMPRAPGGTSSVIDDHPRREFGLLFGTSGLCRMRMEAFTLLSLEI